MSTLTPCPHNILFLRTDSGRPSEPQAAPFVFTGFQPLSNINGKNVASAFGKSEHQSWWTRRADDTTWEAQRHWKKAVMLGGDDSALLSSSSSNVVQPNTADRSNNINGDSSTKSKYHSNLIDPAQRTIVIHPGSRTVQIGRASDSLPISIPNVVARRRVPGSGKQPLNGLFRNCEPYSTSEAKETFTSKTNAIRTELRSRMRAIKLRGITNGQGIAANHNADAAPLTLSEDQDPLGTVWPPISGPEAKDLYVGQDALLIPEPEKNNYAVRWPIVRGQLNSTDDSGYLSKAEVLADIETVWLYALSTHLGIKEQDLKEYSAILILPDIYDHVYLREMVDLLFRALGFKQICLQQESLCACFGAGLGTACVVDIGATKTSVSCVEEGWVLPETRIQLAIGGDDITTVLAEMLRRQNFPYKDLNLNCTWEWQMIEKLKEDMLVLSEGDVNLSSVTFFVRHPQKPTVKWSVRAYDEVIIPAMILFSPSIIEFDRKQSLNKRIYADKEDVDDVLDLGGNPITEAMRNSTSISVFGKPATAVVSTGANVTDPTRLTVARTEESVTGTAEEGASPYTGTPQPTTLGIESNAPTPRPSPNLPGPKPATNPIVPAEAAMTPSAAFVSAVSKIPLHEALVQSILACASEERSKRMASAIMVVGGGALIHNIGYALTTRIQPILAAKYPTIEATMIPPPRDLDPRILAWKGVSLICRIESASDLWIRSSDWEVLGSKAIKDRTIFMC
ncbi:hypothetical protein Pst134EA_025571 [Puccinia striiformis f. sp. tritici]|uniref:hypothetical protein n=1 Tax=Puccinia striiformis f. sp. tritici TaxID=168172 RepID=UPI00200787C3|nr:hypothetical protein Pst134EA_025571 [Puccinia striiformis f. sp. tritici]KAH9451624.1 hypothetical protein Pst134EA_025571 [Puccinia striiformis f. sp. tritici]